MIPPGAYDKLNIKEYHADPSLSSSGLKHLARSPRHYKISRQVSGKKTDPFNVGQGAHSAVLEPETFWDTVAVPPPEVLAKNGARSTNAYREWEAEKIAAGVTILTQDQFEMIRNIFSSVYSDPAHTTAKSALTLPGNIFEQSIFFLDPDYGFPCRIRIDLRNELVHFLADLKTCLDASPSGFSVKPPRIFGMIAKRLFTCEASTPLSSRALLGPKTTTRTSCS
jgi:hypothetical protein